MSLRYRPEIDGLRALAVLPVLFFHAAWPGFGGGYLGVDVFFVISGYLISGIILTELEQGRFTLAGFYERRIRRIAPALLAVLTASLAMAWAWMLPWDLTRFGKSLLAALGLASNLFFARQEGYFAGGVEQDPLLNLWSLSLEEQFYLGFPLLLWALWQWRRQALPWLLAGALLLSLAAAEWQSRQVAGPAFFALHARIWELLAGALALAYERRYGGAGNRWWALVGAAMLGASFAVFSPATVHPSLWTAVPVLGTVLLVLHGGAAGMIGSLLRQPWLVGIGLISYPLYLWHFPLLAFYKYRFDGEPGQGATGALLLLSGVLAFASYRLLERPCRDKARVARRPLMLAVAAAVLLLVAATGSALRLAPGRLAPELQGLLVAPSPQALREVERRYRSGSCLLQQGQSAKDLAAACYGDAARGRGVSVWGDSHAASLVDGLARLYPGLRIGQLTASRCPPAPASPAEPTLACFEMNRAFVDALLARPPHHVVLLAEWEVYGSKDEMLKAVGEAARRLVRHGHTVLIVGGLPQWKPSLPAVLNRLYRRDGRLPQALPWPNAAETERMDAALRRTAMQAGAGFLSLREALPGGLCPVMVEGEGGPKLTAFDQAHLTPEGSLIYAKIVAAALGRAPQAQVQAQKVVHP